MWQNELNANNVTYIDLMLSITKAKSYCIISPPEFFYPYLLVTDQIVMVK